MRDSMTPLILLYHGKQRPWPTSLPSSLDRCTIRQAAAFGPSRKEFENSTVSVLICTVSPNQTNVQDIEAAILISWPLFELGEYQLM